ncbi:MAG TPA: Gfo/Idh/MocA family oxidoreductase [Arenibacter sp.]|nr:Gfo/Idh/MocA family oxidoreductase [Arenibacter sp.]
MNDQHSSSRRKFLLTATAAVSVPFILEASEQPLLAPSNVKLRHASTGVGGMGYHDLKNFIAHQNVEIVALCDVDGNALKRASELVPGARLYTDWRKLLKKEKKKIDSVNVTVPDHNHFIIAMGAIQAGKHVYCQKPMCQ